MIAGLGLALGLWSAAAAASVSAPPPDCSAPGVARQRAAFAKTYRGGDFDRALDLIDSLAQACAGDPPRVDRVTLAEIENDWALALHRTGDDSGCIQTLEAYSPELRRANAHLARLPDRLQTAIRTNFGLCKAFCDGVENYTDAACVWLRVDAQFDAYVHDNFRAAPCAHVRGALATLALGPGRCLVISPPRKPYSIAAAEESRAEDICPRVEIAEGGARRPLAVPGQSFLRDKAWCCGDLALAANPNGRIEVTPSENPPESCLFGHRTNVLQDIFELRGGQLVLTRRMPR